MEKIFNSTTIKSVLKAYTGFILSGLLVFALTGCENSKREVTEEDKTASRIAAYEKLAEEEMDLLRREMAKPVSTYKFIQKQIKRAEDYSWSALELDSTLTSSWERLAYINSHIHGEQAFRRFESFTSRGDKEKAAEAEKEALKYFTQADIYYNAALKFGSEDSAYVYFLMGEALEIHYAYDAAVMFYQDAARIRPEVRKYEARFIRAMFFSQNSDQALYYNEKYREKYPESDIPYLNYALYYYNMGDTVQAVDNYEKAVNKGTRPEVGKFLYDYFMSHGDPERAAFYKEKSLEAQSTWDPEKY
jgi:tetratricopeptide (TPR) repeat protein